MKVKICLVLLTILFTGCSENKSVELPTEVKLSTTNTNNLIAYILYRPTNNWLSGGEYYLAFKENEESKNIVFVNYDIHHGQGNYEGGIIGLYWVDDTTVLIDRYIFDTHQPISYSLNTLTWTTLTIKESNQIIKKNST